MSPDIGMFQRLERFRSGPAWRQQLAMKIAAGQVKRPAAVDEIVRRAAEFSKLSSRGDASAERATKKFPDIAEAESVWNNSELRLSIQLLVLGNLSPREIADQLRISSIVIDVVEQLYFDIRPALQAPGFIAAIVIRGEADKGFDDTAAYMRMAYFGGPYAARALVEARTRLPADQSEQLLDESLLLHAKFRQAIEMELSPAQAMQFLTLAAEIRRDEARILLERDKLLRAVQNGGGGRLKMVALGW